MNTHDLAYLFVGMALVLAVGSWWMLYKTWYQLDLQEATKPLEDLEE